MISGDLLNIQPSELKFPFELKKQSSCSMQLTNKTDKYVAFKVKTTNPKKYCVRPNTGVVLPGSSCNVTVKIQLLCLTVVPKWLIVMEQILAVTMQAQKEAPPDLQCKDKFLLQSVAAPDGATTKDIVPELFNKEEGKVVEEFKLRVIYIPANPPSPVPEGSEEGSSPRASPQANGNQNVSRSLEAPKEKSSEAWSMISKLTDEKTSAMQQNKKLLQELELVRKETSKSHSGGFSLLFVLLVGILGVVIGYLVKRS
ncbi:hypothetical protein EZV62_009655 [Acer yangbiense]|uniref:MSP domain-containing protein n=1 Tax=Acer yangbiense TaxID=1000413 RepID=A0A5C7HZU6_9ROSI|nr:hypothetical protein EZV62_009655 [Acer yangbiense]